MVDSKHQTKLFLLSTDGCHLCDAAASMLDDLGVAFESFDIVEQPELINLYGDKIPVLIADGAEQALFWPFDEFQISQYKLFYGIN